MSTECLSLAWPDFLPYHRLGWEMVWGQQ